MWHVKVWNSEIIASFLVSSTTISNTHLWRYNCPIEIDKSAHWSHLHLIEGQIPLCLSSNVESMGDITEKSLASRRSSQLLVVDDRPCRRLWYLNQWYTRLRQWSIVLGIKDPDSTGARREMRSSGRLTRIVALVKSKCKTWIVSALLRLVSYEGW